MKPTTHQKRAAQHHGEPREQTGEPSDFEPIRYLVCDGSVEVPDEVESVLFFDDKCWVRLRLAADADEKEDVKPDDL